MVADAIEVTDLAKKNAQVAPVTFPEGGTRTWIVVIGAWLLQFTTFGFVNAYGAFNDFYVREYLNNKSSSEIGWIGSLQVALLLGVAGFAGPLFDKGYLHHLVISGSLIFVFCSFMLSITHTQQYYQVILSHGLGIGLGAGLVYLPSLGIVSHYFKKKAPVVLGIVSTGGSLGATLHPIMINRLITSLGFHNAVRINAGINAFLLIIANLVIKTRLPPRPPTKRLFKKIFSDIPYDTALLGGVLMLLGLYFPIFFIQLNSIVNGIDHNFALYTVSIIQAASTFGRILPQMTLRFIPLPWLLVFCTSANAVLLYTFETVQNLAGTICFTLLYGFISGAALSLIPPALASQWRILTRFLAMFANDVSEVGVRIGFGLLLGAMGALVGLPIDGALLSHHTEGETTYIWWKPSVFSGAILSGSAVFFLVAFIAFMTKKRFQ
ncbi:Riboflavin transporter MCH5 [Leucoagaricus sp. SymC.cos]|nr:Riboflavin transporter MCH5 [Leucoagaricus sp. SymC.cos]